MVGAGYLPEAIAPQIGRTLHYWPGKERPEDMVVRAGCPLRAMIIDTYLGHQTMVDVVVTDLRGNQHLRRRVELIQPVSETLPMEAEYCRWSMAQVGAVALANELREGRSE